MVGGWGMGKRDNVGMGAACWRAAYTSLLSLACVTVPVFSCILRQLVPCRSSEGGMRMCWGGEWSPQLSWPSAILFLCSQRKEKTTCSHKVDSLYCLSLSFFPEISQSCTCREQSCLLWVLKWFTGVPKLTPRMRMTTVGTELQGCLVRGKKTQWSFSLVLWINIPFRSKISPLLGAGFHFAQDTDLTLKKNIFTSYLIHLVSSFSACH